LTLIFGNGGGPFLGKHFIGERDEYSSWRKPENMDIETESRIERCYPPTSPFMENGIVVFQTFNNLFIVFHILWFDWF
jgi:hypothetical protein